MTQGSDHAANQDTDNDGDQGQAMGDFYESIAVGRTRRNLRKLSSLTTDTVSYTHLTLPTIYSV